MRPGDAIPGECYSNTNATCSYLRVSFRRGVSCPLTLELLRSPQVAGYEKHVGTETSFDLVNHHHLQLMSNPPGYERHPFLHYGAKTFRAPANKPLNGKSMLVLIESTNSEVSCYRSPVCGPHAPHDAGRWR
jgi:hypothetical protein